MVLCPRCGMEELDRPLTALDQKIFSSIRFHCGTVIHWNGDTHTSILCDKRFLIKKLKLIKDSLNNASKLIQPLQPPDWENLQIKFLIEQALLEIDLCLSQGGN